MVWSPLENIKKLKISFAFNWDQYKKRRLRLTVLGYDNSLTRWQRSIKEFTVCHSKQTSLEYLNFNQEYIELSIFNRLLIKRIYLNDSNWMNNLRKTTVWKIREVGFVTREKKRRWRYHSMWCSLTRSESVAIPTKANILVTKV
jgi:hypothetical protein